MLHHYKIIQLETKQYCNIQNNDITLQKIALQNYKT